MHELKHLQVEMGYLIKIDLGLGMEFRGRGRQKKIIMKIVQVQNY